MADRLFDHPESPADEKEVTPSSDGASAFAVVGVGATGGVLVESLRRIGFDNVLLFGNQDILPIDLPDDCKVVFAGDPPKDMRSGERQAVDNQTKIYEKMKAKFSTAERVFLCVGADGAASAGSTLVMVETISKILSDRGMSSGQRIGVFVAYPTSGELAYSQAVKDARFLVDKLFDFCQRKLIDPLVVTDRSNICALFDSLAAAPVETEVEELVAIAEADQSEDEFRIEHQKKIDQELDRERSARAYGANVYEE